jgi:signal transduction histidine kinase
MNTSTPSTGNKSSIDAAQSLEAYKIYVKNKLKELTPVFANASVGDFSNHVEIPEENDEFTELYAGIQIMLDVIRQNLSQLQELNAALSEKVLLLEDLDKTKDEFIAIAAHQLRTPLGIIRWNAEVLLSGDEGILPPRMIAKLRDIQIGNLRLISLVNNLLSVSRIEQGRVLNEPKAIRLDEQMASIIKEFKQEADKRSIHIQYTADHQLPILWADPNRMHEVLENVLSNAIKYNILGGHVTITTKKSDTHLIITFTDTGIGIPKSDQAKLFLKFTRGSNAAMSQTEGNGLGLFIVKSYIDDWGGTITIQSPLKTQNSAIQGTSVSIALPLSLMRKP